MQGFFTLQRVRPESSPGQTTGHKEWRKARKKHKSQTRHGVENVKRKKTVEFGKTTRRGNTSRKQPGSSWVLGFFILGAWGAWGGGTDGTNGTYRLLLTMGLKMPCAAPRGALQWSLASTEKWIVHNLRGSALRDCHSSRPSPFLFLVEFVLGKARGTSASQGVDPFIIVSSCLPRETFRSLCSSLVPLRVLDAIDIDANDTSTTSPPSLVPAVKPIRHLRLLRLCSCLRPPARPAFDSSHCFRPTSKLSSPTRATLHLSSRLTLFRASSSVSFVGKLHFEACRPRFPPSFGYVFRSGHV